MDMVANHVLISLEPATIAICKYALRSFYYTSSSLCNCYAREFQNSQNHCHWFCLRITFIGGSLLDVCSTLGTITARYEGTSSFTMTLTMTLISISSSCASTSSLVVSAECNFPEKEFVVQDCYPAPWKQNWNESCLTLLNENYFHLIDT